MITSTLLSCPLSPKPGEQYLLGRRPVKRLYTPTRQRGDVDPFFNISSTDLSNFHKVFRLRNYLTGRANSLEKYFFRRFTISNPQGRLFRLTRECHRLRSLSILLDKNSIVSHTKYLEILSLTKKFPRSLEDHCMKLFGEYVKAPKMDLSEESINAFIYRSAMERSKFGRKAELMSRLSSELKQRSGWFLLFNTLTVAPGRELEVFSRGSKAWQDYIRKVDRMFGIAACGSVRKALNERRAGNEYHSYFGVVERGTKHGRLHIHVLHLFKVLPKGFSDPNLGQVIPKRRIIDALRDVWSYGFTSPIAIRNSPNDAYGKLGWRWPVSVVDGKVESLKVSSWEQVAGYVGKYINKSFNEESDQSWQMNNLKVVFWRTKLSRQMGVKEFRKVVDRLTMYQAKVLVQEKRLPMVPSCKLPQRLLKKLLLQKYLLMMIRMETDYVFNFLQDIPSPKTLSRRYFDMIHRACAPNPQSSGNFRALSSLREVAFNRVVNIFRETLGETDYAVNGLKGPSWAVSC